MAEKKGNTSGSLAIRARRANASLSHGSGQTSPIPPTSRIPLAMTKAELMSLLARVQDICAVWEGSDNKIFGMYLMVALPVPPAYEVSRLDTGHGRVFCVNGSPVVAVMTELETK